jgi:hypothetical protein
MKVSYAITVCNEQAEIIKLVELLLDTIRDEDEIVVLYDQTNGNSEIPDWLRKHTDKDNFDFRKGYFKGHFANWKNTLTEYCTGDYIFQIDADEFPHKSLITSLPLILAANPTNEVYLVPRVNTVEGLTEEHISRWGWKVDDKGWVNYPDYQWRIWKNKPEIRWKNKVHEVLDGYQTYAPLPAKEELSLYHPKGIERQEKQNAYYDTLG